MEELNDAKKRKYIDCVRSMKNMGMSEIEAQIHCANLLMKDNKKKTSHNLQLMYGTDDEEVIEDGKPSQECISRKISIFHREHPEWEHDQVVAAAHSYCRKKTQKDAILPVKQSGETEKNPAGAESDRTKGISLTKFSTLVRLIKSKLPLKQAHMAQGSLQPLLPMKNFNKLQTKLEKLFTEESKFLTAEELAQRTTYAKFMKKDFMDAEVDKTDGIAIAEMMYDFLQTIPDKSIEMKSEMLFDYMTNPILVEEGWVDSQVEVGKINTGLKNIIKAPIILAREMVQRYTFRDQDGTEREEYHFKPYSELADSIKGLDRLYMILEHKDTWELGDTLGCVRDLKADPKIRGIRGMGYFVRKNLPVAIADALERGDTISVSIGFMADLMRGGVFEGKHYDYTQTNIILDHLAVCLDSTPRCPDDLCGVNVKEAVMTDSENFTLISKPNYYYNINKDIIDTIEETSKKNIKEENISKNGDSMEDSFPDKTSGLTAGGETPDFEAFLSGLRKFMAGVSDPDEKATLRRRILRTMNLTDEDETIEDSEPEEEIGEEEMDEKEFQDAIAAKDADIEVLKKKIADFEEEKRQDKIKEIKSLSDAYADDELESKNIESLKIIADAVSRFKPSEAKTPVVPIAAKNEELKKEIEDSETQREKPSEVFSEISKDFNLSSV